MGINHLKSIEIDNFKCKSLVTNEFLDLLTSYDIPEHGLDKLSFRGFMIMCNQEWRTKLSSKPFEEEVLTRIAQMCHNLSQLKLSNMLTEKAGSLSVANLFIQIIHNNPPIEVLNLE